MKILLGDFCAKVGRKDIFKPAVGNESLHEVSNDNGVRVVNFATSKNHRVKSTMFPHRNIYKYNCMSIKNGVFWDVMLCGSCKNRRFGGT
jgi:hypothetical protein